MSISIPKANITTINQSIAIVLSADQKTPLSPEQITPSKRINEQESYATLVHHSLTSTHPQLAKRFEQELKQATESYKKNHGDTNMFKISDRIVRQFVREKAITQEQYQALRNYSFGNAQLDNNRTLLSSARAEDAIGDNTPVRAVSTFYKKLETNQPATSEEIAIFRAEEAKISVQKWREKQADQPIKPTNTIAIDGGIDTLKSVDSIAPGFLWKPSSESDGRLVVLLPSTFTQSVHSVSLASPSGKTDLEGGKYSGIGNGGRLHFRFGKSGSSYPDGTNVVVTFVDGSTLRIPIKDTGTRVES